MIRRPCKSKSINEKRSSETDRVLLHSELAYANAAIFAGKPLRFLALDQIIFSLPVPIGAVVRMKAVTVTSTRPKTKEELSDGLELTSAGNAKVHVVVTAQIQDLAKGVSDQRPALE